MCAGDWYLVVALGADQTYYLVEWDTDKECFWDQGTRYLKPDLTYWMSVREPQRKSTTPKSSHSAVRAYRALKHASHGEIKF